ncbi:phosphotransferase [Bifidobacterium amazonense]|uniref:phosphotransferase n=1 Tax=Bifidobacterium amazonense TaxID=2809027 RepID=UPI003B849195
MQRTPVDPHAISLPASISPYVGDEPSDSSPSTEAKVRYPNGHFIKTAADGAPRHEARLTDHLHGKRPAAPMPHHETDEPGHDRPVTARIPGQDCTAERYMRQPERLVTILAHRLRAPHDLDASDRPDRHRLNDYLATTARNHAAGHRDTSFHARGTPSRGGVVRVGGGGGIIPAYAERTWA